MLMFEVMNIPFIKRLYHNYKEEHDKVDLSFRLLEYTMQLIILL